MIYLKEGSRRPVVTTLQVLLQGLTADGHFGSMTRRKVVAYQSTHAPKLQADGVVGKKTWPALLLDRDMVSVDVIDADELVGEDGRKISNPRGTFTGAAMLDLQQAGANPIVLYGQSNGIATMVFEIKRRVGRHRRMALLRIYGHGVAGSQNVTAGKGALDEHMTSLDPATLVWTMPLMAQLAPYFAPWGCLELHGCHVGEGARGAGLLRSLSAAVQVPVTAGSRNQYSGGRATWIFEGPTATSFPYGGDLKGWSTVAAAR